MTAARHVSLGGGRAGAHSEVTLEFEAIRTLLERHAGSRRGRVLVRSLTPSSDANGVRQSLALTTEAVRALALATRQPYGDLPDIEAEIAAARVEGSHLEAPGLLAVASFLEGAWEIAARVGSCVEAPSLARRASQVLDGTPIAVRIRRAVLPTGEIADNASPRLAEIRTSLVRMRSHLSSVMEAFLRDPEKERVLQDRLVTTRNDRYVLVVKAENRGAVPGIVHSSSGSGASLFVEPLPTVELNNDIVARTEDERSEILRILKSLTDEIRIRAGEIALAAEVMGELDAFQARALLARDMAAVEPRIAVDGEANLIDGRHPLLIPRVIERLGGATDAARDPVPVSLRVGGAESILVISGPNTGGKTVALKTLGLACLMAQSGLHVAAAEGTALPVFRSIFADIGDEQSIAANLSTFSAHLAAIVSMMDGLERPALVLLDEVGAGTDPTEGGALGVAIVDAFRSRGATVVATTHHGVMKAYAQQTEGVACASFGYDPRTYAPTYRLARGESGRSLAFEMAERYGLPREVVEDARSRVSQEQLDLDQLLRRLEVEKEALAQDRASLAELRASLEMSLARQRQAEAEVEAVRRAAAGTFARELRRRGDEAARKASDAIREAVRRVEASKQSLNAESARARSAAIEAIREARTEALQDLPLEPADPEPAEGEVRQGDRVRVRELGIVGEVIALSGGTAEVAVAGKRVRVQRRELDRLAPTQGPGKAASAVALRREPSGASEINLVGLRVDEALPRLDKALDDAALADRDELRIIHGFGEGRLRRAVAEMLADHPHVASFRAGRSGEGGGGATIVELK